MDRAPPIEHAFAALARGDHAEAASCARAVLREFAQDPAALTVFGRLALVDQKPDVARQIFEGLLNGPHERAATWLDLAQALTALHLDREALQAVERSLVLDSSSVPAWLELGAIGLSRGDRPRATEAFSKALALNPNCTKAYRGLCEAGSMAPQGAMTVRMRQLAATPGLAQHELAELHYALARVHRSAGQEDAFIEHLFAANAAQRAISPGTRGDYQQHFDRLESMFTAGALRKAATAHPSHPTPIFILGMPRSGTTLVETLLAAHPEVAAAGELDFMRGPLRRAMESQTRRPFLQGFEELSQEQMSALAAPYVHRLQSIAGEARFVTDKTPGNFHLLGLLPHLFPGCRIVHVARDPMDTCFSILQYPFDVSSPHTCDIDLLAYAYARYRRLMRRWASLCPEAFVTVEYEQLVTEPAAQAQRLFEYCALQWQDSYLELSQQARHSVRTFSALQVRQPIHRAAIGGWRPFAEALRPLSEALARELEEVGVDGIDA